MAHFSCLLLSHGATSQRYQMFEFSSLDGSGQMLDFVICDGDPRARAMEKNVDRMSPTKKLSKESAVRWDESISYYCTLKGLSPISRSVVMAFCTASEALAYLEKLSNISLSTSGHLMVEKNLEKILEFCRTILSMIEATVSSSSFKGQGLAILSEWIFPEYLAEISNSKAATCSALEHMAN
ncbi:hypothetical protein MDAP_001833 [Mitosporidium daphniae]